MPDITYRTDGAWGSGKGADLTPVEVDLSFWSIEVRLTAIETSPPSPLEISNITVTGGLMTVFMDGGGSFGPFDVKAIENPQAPVKTVATVVYTPTVDDRGFYHRMTNAAGCAVTIPDNDAVNFPINTELHFRQSTGSPVTFVGDGAAVINGMAGFDDETAGDGAVATLKKVGTDQWDLFGYLAEATTGGTGT